jgi:hypothetical protein
VFILQFKKNQLLNFPKRADTSAVLIVYDGVLCEVRAYNFTVSYRYSA